MENNLVSDIDFYKSFEDVFRGSRYTIKQRLTIYLDFVLPIKDEKEIVKALDLGCGRGEWLELLNENNICSFGVDLDDGMLKECVDRNLNVENSDAINYLRKQRDSSIDIISAFHIIEHIGADNVYVLVKEALRVLTPGGILILETPNPENIMVSTNYFYLDQTHERPIPSELMLFLAEYYGYHKYKILRLQDKYNRNTNEITLLDVLGNVSPDYALVAKKYSEITNNKMEVAFDGDYGISFHELCSSYDKKISQMVQQNKDIKLESQILKQEIIEIRKNLDSKIFHINKKPIEYKISIVIDKMKLLVKHVILYISRRPRLVKIINYIFKLVPPLKKLVKNYIIQKDVNVKVIHFSAKELEFYEKIKEKISNYNEKP